MSEARFSDVIAPLVNLLGCRGLFQSDSDYTHFSESYVVPATVALACAASKDVLWKPMNHKVLLLSRDKSPAVRAMSVATLHALFQEVGEEYLILLPECIPFLAELLEDDSRQIVTATRELIMFIEGLSGESLDQYIQ